jgi:hypothetical protein
MKSRAYEYKPWMHDWYGNTDLEVLQQLAMITEGFLVQEAKKLQNRFAEELNKHTSDDSHLMDLASEENWLVNEVFPNILRSCLLVAFVSCLETNLAKTCGKLSKTGRFKSLEVPPQKITIDTCRNYLKKTVRLDFPDQTLESKEIEFYRKLRNRIVHGEARLDKRMKDYIDLSTWINSKASLRLDSLGKVILEKAFLFEVNDTLEQFYKNFYRVMKAV